MCSFLPEAFWSPALQQQAEDPAVILSHIDIEVLMFLKIFGMGWSQHVFIFSDQLFPIE